MAVLKPLSIVLGIVVLLGLIYLSTQLGPKKVVEGEHRDMQVESPLVAEKRGAVTNLINTFDGIAQQREPSKADLELLKQAIDIQIQVVRLNQAGNLADSALLEELRKRHDTLQGAFIYEESVSEQQLGAAALDGEDREAALVHYKRAFELQQLIHEDFIDSDYVNHRRLVNLKHQLDEIELGPRYEESVRLEGYAEQSIKVRDWKAAKDFLDRALAIQKDINQNYMASRYKNVGRYSQLETLRMTVASGTWHDEVLALREQAEALLEAGNYREAAARLQEATVKQSQINAVYSASRFASEDTLREIDNRRQTALSSELADAINQTDVELSSALRDRKAFEAIQLASKMKDMLERLKSTYPNSERYRDDLMLKVSFLGLRQDDIGYIQDRVYNQLIALEEMPGLLMLKTEVSQVLYERITGTNPSRNRNELYPVDSVTWIEVNEFCERLGWMLGRTVRPPTRKEFELAVGDIRYAPLGDMAWHSRNTSRDTQQCGTQKPNAAGFYDLLGNVSEWLSDKAESMSEGALVSGGNVGDSIEKLASIPVGEYSLRERNRFTGFRIVVEMDGFRSPLEEE